MIAVELNTALKAHLLTLGTPYSTVKLRPLSAYGTTDAPFVIYNEFLSTVSDEKYFMRVSNITYVVYDNDISRMKDIAYYIEQFLNVGDNCEGIRALLEYPYYDAYYNNTFRYRITSVRLMSGGTIPPVEREGFAGMSMSFRVGYVNS